MPAGHYLFIPFLRTKSQKREKKNRSSKKSHRKTDSTNIIATNLIWEQLITLILEPGYFFILPSKSEKHTRVPD